MKFKIILLFITILIILTSLSCDRLFGVFNSSNSTPDDSRISFTNLKVGQESRYVLYQMENAIWLTDSMTCKFYADTLVLKIISYDKVHYYVHEQLSEGSTIPNDNLGDWIRHMLEGDGITYLMRVIGDSIYFSFPNGWSSLYTSPQTPFSLEDINTNLLNLNSCNAVRTPITSEGYAVKYKYDNNIYPRLNVLVNTEMFAVDGPGYVYIYSGLFGLVNTYSMNPWTNAATGWQLLE
ncbi:hypothetical protein ACFLQG_01595 [Candidatus Zixiibacteriota bacterium]